MALDDVFVDRKAQGPQRAQRVVAILRERQSPVTRPLEKQPVRHQPLDGSLHGGSANAERLGDLAVRGAFAPSADVSPHPIKHEQLQARHLGPEPHRRGVIRSDACPALHQENIAGIC